MEVRIMKSSEDFAERFRADVEKKCGCPVYKKALKRRFNLYKHEEYPYGVFAYIVKRVTLDRFNISTWEKHAEAAGVAHLADDRRSNGMFQNGEVALYWYVKEGDAESYTKAVDALSKICQVR